MDNPTLTENQVLMQCLAAIEKSIQPLANEASLLGFGESFRECMDALASCLNALDAHSALCAAAGVETKGSAAYPNALELFRRHNYRRRNGTQP